MGIIDPDLENESLSIKPQTQTTIERKLAYVNYINNK